MEAERREQMAADMLELANLRSRVQDAEHRADNNAGAAQLLSHMVNAGQIKQIGEQQIILNAVGGVQQFGVNEGLQEIIPYQGEAEDQQLQEEPENA